MTFLARPSIWTVVYILWLMMAGTAAASPQIFWASDPIGPDETALVFGSDLDTVERVRVARMSDTPAGTDAADGLDWREVPAIERSEHSLKFTLPADLEAGVVRYELQISSGPPISGELNGPTVYWAQGDLGPDASAGGWIRVLGRNVARNAGARLALSRADGPGGIAVELPASQWSLWDTSFELPADLHAGRYRLRIWNGQGDATAWRDAGEVEIAPRPADARPVLNARDFGADGADNADDTAAIGRALREAGRVGGAVVLLPRGRYRLSDGLEVPENVVLRGESRELTSLAWGELAQRPEALVSGRRNFAVEDLTLFAWMHGHVISGGFVGRSPAPDAENIAIRRVRVRASIYRGHQSLQEITGRMGYALKEFGGARGPDTVRLTGSNLVIEDSDLYGSARSLYLLKPHGARIAGNQLYNGRRGWYSITAADGVIFENNLVMGADLQASGGGINTLSGGAAALSSRNVLFRGNRFEMMNGWDREAMTSDGPGGCYLGRVEAESGTRFRLRDPQRADLRDPSVCRGAAFMVVGGRGAGSFARVAEVGEKAVEIERALPVPLDRSSIVAITPLQMNYLMIGNSFTDAGVGIQFFGASIDHVVADNSSVRTGGFVNRGLTYRGFQPNWFIQYLGNRVAESYVRNKLSDSVMTSDSLIQAWAQQRGDDEAPLVLGIVVRNNDLHGNARIDIKSPRKDVAGVMDAVIEGNSIADTDVGIVIDDGASRIFLRDNRFDGVTEEIRRSSGRK